MIKSAGNKVTFIENYTLGLADVLLVYSMLSPILLLIIGAEIKLEPNFFRTLIVLLGPGLLAGAIYFQIHGIQALKGSKWIIVCMLLFALACLRFYSDYSLIGVPISYSIQVNACFIQHLMVHVKVQ